MVKRIVIPKERVAPHIGKNTVCVNAIEPRLSPKLFYLASLDGKDGVRFTHDKRVPIPLIAMAVKNPEDTLYVVERLIDMTECMADVAKNSDELNEYVMYYTEPIEHDGKWLVFCNVLAARVDRVVP